jgi:hypothetical protein
MFEKLLANLPYNPNLIKQVGFYARRMRREESIRRTGLVFIVLAFMVQFFAFISPPASTSAYSTSDMINNGFSSQSEAVTACKKNVKNYGDALWNFHISCKDVANGTTTWINSNDHKGRLYSLSWLPYGPTNPNSGKATDETPLNLAKVSETIYARLLTSADHLYPYSKYKVLQVTANDGTTYWIMYLCGNLMSVGVPKPAPTCRMNGNVYYAGSKECTPPTTPAPQPAAPTPSQPKPMPCPYDSSVAAGSAQCKPCTESLSSEDALACMVDHKSATNVTQNIANADGSTAQPNDVIVYTLFAANQGKAAVKDFVMQENLNDVLDYADVVDLHGGTLSTSGTVSWPATTVAAGTTLTHQITVRVKNPLPDTAPSPSDPNHFDHIMTNVYGNAVNINLPTPPIVAAAATTTTQLPNTGPGAGLILAAAIVIVAGYFFARARLLVDESMLVIQEANAGTLS